jgi:hypothetical protein
MVLKRRFGGIPAGRVNYYDTHSASFFQKRTITGCLPTHYAVAQKMKWDRLEEVTATKSRFIGNLI